jgi:hypothetical protein
MRLVIDFDEKYIDLFLEAAKTAKATVTAEKPDFWEELPEYVKAGIKRGQEQARNGQTKSYEEVKNMMAKR